MNGKEYFTRLLQDALFIATKTEELSIERVDEVTDKIVRKIYKPLIEYWQKKAKSEVIKLAELWRDSGDVNIKSFEQFLREKNS